MSMTAPLQKKWFRVEQDASGAILSCTEVDAKGRKGAHVRYYEAADAADAASQAKAWHEKSKAHARKSNMRPDRIAKRKARTARIKAEGLCVRCEKASAPSSGALCAECNARRNENQRRKRAGDQPILVRRLADPEVKFARHKELQKLHQLRVRATWGSSRAKDLWFILQRFDAAVRPSDFRGWIVGKITQLGGAKGLAEYEASRAESLDRQSTAAHKRAARARRAA